MSKGLPFEWMVGLRYALGGRRGGRNRFISLLSITGIALGVAALIIVLSIMNGFRKDVTDRMLSVLAHIELFDPRGSMPDWQEQARKAMQNPAVKAAAPFVETQALMLRDRAVAPVQLRGILPGEETKVSSIAGQVREGSLGELSPGAFRIVIGRGLARDFRLTVGDKVTLALARAQITPAGVLPRTRAFTVAGIFEAGHPQIDDAFAFIHLEDAQRLERIDAPAGLRLRIADMHQAPQVAAQLKQSLPGGLRVRDWSELNAAWFAAVQTEKKLMFIVLALVIMVAACNLVSMLVMTVTDKQADIAILRTLGSSSASIMKLFMIQGGLSGLIGTVAGVAGGVAVALNIDLIVPRIEAFLGVQFLPKDIYMFSNVPSDLHWVDVSWIGLVSVLLAFAATIYPSWAAARVKPAEALRYE